jgi:hypothetical protein
MDEESKKELSSRQVNVVLSEEVLEVENNHYG